MGAKKQTESVRLTDEEYQAALDELAEFQNSIREASRLSAEGTLEKAEVLDRLMHDDRWVAERNAERAAFAKTPAGGRPIDPTSRSQFATWLRGRFTSIHPSRTYQLLDAKALVETYFDNVEITPTSEGVVRPLKILTNVLHGSGKRIIPVWEIACGIAQENGYRDPTEQDVKRAIAQWNHEHLSPGQVRRESRHEKASRKRSAALSAWHSLCDTADAEEIKKFLATVQQDVEKLKVGKSWAAK